MDPKTVLLQQKHLLSEIDHYIYSTFLEEDEINSLLEIFKDKQANLENLLNRLQIRKGYASKKIFMEYASFRKKLFEKENEFFEKVLTIESNCSLVEEESILNEDN